MPFELPRLPYPSNALEPHIDAQTMEIHHTKHHAAYVAKANAALEGTSLADQPIETVLANLNDLPADKRSAVRNNAGGHANHSLFWQILAAPGKPGGVRPSGPLADAISKHLGSFDAMEKQFSDAAANRFGSGWAWLCAHPDGALEICSTANQDSPLMHPAIGDAAGCNATPILGLDVWEHAYYLKYQNKRPDYIAAFWNIVNWNKVGELYQQATA